MTRFWKTSFSVLGAFALLSIAGFAVATAPDSNRVTAPFEQYAKVGETVDAREITVTVDAVRLSERLETTYAFTSPDTRTEGVWVVIDATVTMRSGYNSLSAVRLSVGDYTFGGSDILPTPRLIDFFQSSPGLPVTGSLVFEVPSFVLELPEARKGTVFFALTLTPSLDTVPVVTVDLSDTPAASIVVDAPQIGGLE